eukprot:353424-Chlamydomonas_euryale.AAC.3
MAMERPAYLLIAAAANSHACTMLERESAAASFRTWTTKIATCYSTFGCHSVHVGRQGREAGALCAAEPKCVVLCGHIPWGRLCAMQACNDSRVALNGERWVPFTVQSNPKWQVMTLHPEPLTLRAARMPAAPSSMVHQDAESPPAMHAHLHACMRTLPRGRRRGRTNVCVPARMYMYIHARCTWKAPGP